MNSRPRFPLAPAAVLAALLAATLAIAAAPRAGLLDRGRLVVFENGTPVGYEDFQYERQGDSLMVSAVQTRTVRDTDGSTVKWVKKFGLVVDGNDFGLHRYTSNVLVNGHETQVKGILPGDTSMTVYTEVNGEGNAVRLTQPPGRMFVLDPMMFTLFDVVCRNISAQTLQKRPVELVTLGDEPGVVRAMATAAGPDTVEWGGHRMVTHRWVIADDKNTFVAWVSPSGQMLRLLHQGGSLEVLRREPGASGSPGSGR